MYQVECAPMQMPIQQHQSSRPRWKTTKSKKV